MGTTAAGDRRLALAAGHCRLPLFSSAVHSALHDGYADPDCVASEEPLQTTVVPSAISLTYRGTSTEGADAMPIVFTWPVITPDVHPEDFRLTLTNGDVLTPTAAGMWPNFELGERNTIVLVGEYANRGRAEPLMFLGPDGERSGVGPRSARGRRRPLRRLLRRGRRHLPRHHPRG